MPDFDRNSNYNKNAGIAQVKIGEKKPVLDVEFNEMQVIQRDKLSRVVALQVGDGIYSVGTTSYTGGTFTVANEKALVNGELIDISSLSIALAEGESVYLDTFDKEVSYLSTLKSYGNEQEDSNEDNYLVDSRVGVETSRRIVLAYTLSKTAVEEGHHYLKLAHVAGGKLILDARCFRVDYEGDLQMDAYDLVSGVYTRTEYKREDGTLHLRSTLSGGTAPNFTTMTWEFFDSTGVIVVYTKAWTLTYDADGKIVTRRVVK